MNELYMRFPGGKGKALTLSYDDGVEQDIRLIDIMRRNGLKGTFNLNSGLFEKDGHVYPAGTIHRRMTWSQALEVYTDSGMEVAVHTSTHPWLPELPDSLVTLEVLRDRMVLEEKFHRMVRGMAYPFGACNDDVVDCLRRCGIVYSRTTESTGRFDIPTDWLRLPATCHHNDPRLMELARQFADNVPRRTPILFYLWGHSYEFEQKNNWSVIENFASFLGGRADIWYATNLEIYEYIEAYHRLLFSADGLTVTNPTTTALFFQFNFLPEAFCIRPGETLRLDPTVRG